MGMEQQQQLETIEDLKRQIEELQKENDTKDELIKDAKQREIQSKDELIGMEQQMTQWRGKCENAESKMDAMNDAMTGKENEQKRELTALSEENERLSHELKLAQDRAQSLDDKKVEMQERLNNAIES